jgi:hypothetical protein
MTAPASTTRYGAVGSNDASWTVPALVPSVVHTVTRCVVLFWNVMYRRSCAA